MARGASLAVSAALALTACSAAVSGSTDRPDPEVTATQPLPGPEDADEGGTRAPSADEEQPSSDTGEPDGPLSDMTVVIDPGHNGGNAEAGEKISRSVPAGPQEKECDTVGAETGDGYAEHEFTWDFSKRLRDHLEAEGASVILTRDDNESVGPCINERAEIGNEAAADAAISIHADGSSSDVRGFHVIAPGMVDGYTDDIVEPSRQLAEDVRDEFHKGSGHPYSDYLGDEGIDQRTDLGGLNMSDVPKVFLEVGNMRNADDAENIRDKDWRERASGAAANGIARYLSRG
ncbi:MAG: N-acetylmuramoyl-L-alanine amidase [Nocardiopsaceae bacterium]|nr:N-acetylmuramoyl-L-alanine amidase [Nocardiopsaceae bacterium]